jgi:hypothetical protein
MTYDETLMLISRLTKNPNIDQIRARLDAIEQAIETNWDGSGLSYATHQKYYGKDSK